MISFYIHLAYYTLTRTFDKHQLVLSTHLVIQMANIDEQEFTRDIIRCMLYRTPYRNNGYLPRYEEPIYQMMDAVRFYDRSEEDQERIAAIALAAFDNRDYPGRGTMPGLEQPIQTMLVALSAVIGARAH